MMTRIFQEAVSEKKRRQLACSLLLCKGPQRYNYSAFILTLRLGAFLPRALRSGWSLRNKLEISVTQIVEPSVIIAGEQVFRQCPVCVSQFCLRIAWGSESGMIIMILEAGVGASNVQTIVLCKMKSGEG